MAKKNKELVSIFGGEQKVTKEYKEMLGQLQTDDNLIGSGGFSGKKLSIRGSLFRKVISGEEVGSIDERALNIVIVKAAPLSRTYYDKQYVEGEEFSPKCWSGDCKLPSPDVPEGDRGASKCGKCKQNIKGSGQGDSRACRFSQRVAIMLEGGIEEDGIYQLIVPSMSIFGSPNKDGSKMPLQAYAKFLATNKTPTASIITEMRFDSDSSTPKLTFKPVRALDEAEMGVVLKMQDHDSTEQAIVMEIHKTVGNSPKELPAPEEASEDAPKKKKKKKKNKNKGVEEDEAPKAKKKSKEPEPEEDVDLAAVLSEWDDD